MDTTKVSDFDMWPHGAYSRPTTVQVVCSVCLQEVPISEAMVPEATDYLIYLCGLDCYARWRSGGRTTMQKVDS